MLTKTVMRLELVLELTFLRHSESALDLAEVLAKKVMGLEVVSEMIPLTSF